MSSTRGHAAGGQRKLALVAPVRGMVDLGLGPFVERVLERADEQGAAVVILNIDTFGGRLDAVVAIRDTLLGSRIKTVAFVNKRAISATGATGADRRCCSARRRKDRFVCQKRVSRDCRRPQTPRRHCRSHGRCGRADRGHHREGQAATEEALEHKVADFEADDMSRVLAGLGLAGAEVSYVTENWAERLVRFLTHPIVSSLLMTLGMLVELRTPGFGFPGIIGVGLLSHAEPPGRHWHARDDSGARRA